MIVLSGDLYQIKLRNEQIFHKLLIVSMTFIVFVSLIHERCLGVGHSGTHLITEIKQCWARLVLIVVTRESMPGAVGG
jgi:hypothetical protein